MPTSPQPMQKNNRQSTHSAAHHSQKLQRETKSMARKYDNVTLRTTPRPLQITLSKRPMLRGVLRPDGGTDNTYGERGEYSRFALDTID